MQLSLHRTSIIMSTLAAAAVLLAVLSVAGVSADRGGCPNAASANGAAHANPNSAHGPAKQEARGCAAAVTGTPGPTGTEEPSATPGPTEQPTEEPTAEPTPEPTPTLTPTPTPEPGGETATPEPTPTLTPTPTPEPTPTPTPTPEPSPQ